jgi:hypothetical protein
MACGLAGERRGNTRRTMKGREAPLTVIPRVVAASMRRLDAAISRGMTWVYFAIRAAMAVKVRSGKIQRRCAPSETTPSPAQAGEGMGLASALFLPSRRQGTTTGNIDPQGPGSPLAFSKRMQK